MSSLFQLINIPFSYVIRFFYSVTGNYMLALLGFAVVVKLVLFPLGIKQQKNMVKQATLRPREMAIRAKYAGRTDKLSQQKMQQEVMEFYQKENYNPAGGCLPMLVQLIVIWAIYQIVYGPLTYLCALSADGLTALKAVLPTMVSETPELLEKFSTLIATGDTGATFRGNEIQLVQIIKSFEPTAILDALNAAGTYTAELVSEIESVITNLPNITFFGMDLSEAPSVAFNVLMLIPILNLVTTFVTTKLTKKLTYQAPTTEEQQNAASMKIMEYAMPLMIFYMAFKLPAALGVYWIYQNLLGILQQFILSKLYPYPKFTDEEIRETARQMKLAEKEAPKQQKSSGKPVRSLHHIDDDDYPADYDPKKQKKKPSAEVPDEPEKTEPTEPAEPEKTEEKGIEKARIKD